MGKTKPLEVAAGNVIAVRMVVKEVFKPFISANLPYVVCKSLGYGDLKISPDAVIEILGHIPSPEEERALLIKENEDLQRKCAEILQANTELLAQQVQAKLEGKS